MERPSCGEITRITKFRKKNKEGDNIEVYEVLKKKEQKLENIKLN